MQPRRASIVSNEKIPPNKELIIATAAQDRKSSSNAWNNAFPRIDFVYERNDSRNKIIRAWGVNLLITEYSH